ncbi:MAG: carboxylesterase family protein [Deltaproteobacteria bacterium]|nr:carboxylesterase family protein [Deltaproteobacteria bacterium]
MPASAFPSFRGPARGSFARFSRSSSVARIALVALAVGGMGCGGSEPEVDSSSQRKLEQGEVVGHTTEAGRVQAWRGLPYAAPPVGPLRWRAPEPAPAWEGVRTATQSGSRCVQLGGEPVQGSEDCLYLDVFAPAVAGDAVPRGDERWPVLFWIHGGGNSMGWGDQVPPSALVRDHEVVVVTINYRLGIFGWLSHPALRASARGPLDASGNFGTLDMIQALRWVRENIAEFGGDPGNVTIFGESAGGVNVYSLLISPAATGLFHAAISQSGMPATVTRAQAENWTDEGGGNDAAGSGGAVDAVGALQPGLPGSSGELLLALLRQEGRASSRAEAKQTIAGMTEAEIEAFLRGLSPEALLQPFVDVMGDEVMPMYMSPAVVRDGVVIPEGRPLDVLAGLGGHERVPFIAGTNRDEHKLFFLMSSPHVERLFGLPTGLKNARLYDLEGEYGGAMWRAMGADEPVSALAARSGPSVFAYRFDWDEEPRVLGVDLAKLLGAAHALDLLFVFGQTELGFANRFVYDDPESAERLSHAMRSYWANFAYTHDPDRGRNDDLPDWEPWSNEPEAPKYLILDSDRDGGIEVGTDRIDASLVLARAERDPRLASDEERCRVFRNFVQWSEALTPEGYAAIASGACRAHPLGTRTPFPSLSHEFDPEG